jgi:uncharacterized protein (DUF433 family)
VRKDWSGCELVEVIPGKVSGRPLLKGTRIPADVIIENYDLGCPIEELHEDYPSLSTDTIQQLIRFAEEHRRAPVA